MKSHIAVRAECEAQLLASGMKVTIVRPWHVLGPRHRWPYVLLPMFWIGERIPATREGAKRLGLVTLAQLIRALVAAVEIARIGGRFIEVPQIRTGSVPGLITPKCRVQRWNYESACTWDIFLLAAPGEMLDRLEST